MCCVSGFVVCCYYGHKCAVPEVYNRKQIADMLPENHLTCGALWTRGAHCSHGAVAARCPRWPRCPRRTLEPRSTRLARRPAVSLWPRGSDRSDEAGDALSWGAHWPDGAWLSRGASLSVVTSVAWRSRNSLQAHHAGRAGATASPLGSGKPDAVLARHARKARCPVGTRGSRRAWRPSVALGAHRPCLVLPGGTGRPGRAHASGRRSVLGRLRLFRGSDGMSCISMFADAPVHTPCCAAVGDVAVGGGDGQGGGNGRERCLLVAAKRGKIDAARMRRGAGLVRRKMEHLINFVGQPPDL